jgi:hypothetical protein
MNSMNMNSHVIRLALLLAMLPAAAALAADRPKVQPFASAARQPVRSLSAIQVDVHAALRAEAVTRRLRENAAEVVRLMDLYREMGAHPKRDSSLFLRRLGLQVRSRLERVQGHIERQSSQPERDVKLRTAGLLIPAVAESRVLAQQMGVPGGPAAGPAAPPAAAQAANNGTIDYGPELVALIQQTISPATWDINGGNGAVVYFSPRRAIVVSAPEKVHDKVDDVLGQLRAAP